MARTKEERDALRAELEQEEKDEAARSRGGGGSTQNLHVDVTEAVRDKLITPREGRRLLGLDDGDDDGGGTDDDGDDDGKGKKKKDDDDDESERERDRTPRRRGYFKE